MTKLMVQKCVSNLFASREKRWLLFSFMYLVATIILSEVSIIPDMIRAFLSLPSMLIIPAVWGFPLVKLFHLSRVFQNETVSLIVLSWLIGIFVLTVVATAMQFLSVFSMVGLSLITAGLSFSTLLLNQSSMSTATKDRKMDLTNLGIILVAILVGIIPVLIASINIPYPLFGLNYDLPRSISQPSLRAIESNYLALSDRVPEVLLVSFSAFLYRADPLGVLWAARFILGSVFSAGIFIFIQRVTKRWYFALLASLLAPLLMVGSLDPTWTPFFDVPAQHFRSNTILYAIFPYALYMVDVALAKVGEGLKLQWKKTLLPACIMLFVVFVYFEFPEGIFGLPPFYKLLRIDPVVLPILLVASILIAFFYLEKLDNYTRPLSLAFFWMVLSFSIIHREEAPFFMLVIFLYAILKQSSANSDESIEGTSVE